MAHVRGRRRPGTHGSSQGWQGLAAAALAASPLVYNSVAPGTSPAECEGTGQGHGHDAASADAATAAAGDDVADGGAGQPGPETVRAYEGGWWRSRNMRAQMYSKGAPAARTPAPEGSVHVACVGDSITYGFDPHSSNPHYVSGCGVGVVWLWCGSARDVLFCFVLAA